MLNGKSWDLNGKVRLSMAFDFLWAGGFGNFNSQDLPRYGMGSEVEGLRAK